MDAIAFHIWTERYDIVALQEVWDHKDFKEIKEAVVAELPEAYYFHSDLMGSGMCVFTKGAIQSTMMHRYSANMFPEFVDGRDGFCGNGVIGLVRVLLRGMKIDVYVSHFPPECTRDSARCRARRIQQMVELSQFVNETANGDVSVVLGNHSSRHVTLTLVLGSCAALLLLLCFYFACGLLALKLEQRELESVLAMLMLLKKTQSHEPMPNGGG